MNSDNFFCEMVDKQADAEYNEVGKLFRGEPSIYP